MKLYLAGPMRGIPQFNFPLFDSVAATLRGKGYTIISPAELDDSATRDLAMNSPDGEAGEYFNGQTFGDFLSRDLKKVLDEAEGVALLPGWENSIGASIEAYAARRQGKPLYAVKMAKEGFMGLELIRRPGHDNAPAIQAVLDAAAAENVENYVAEADRRIAGEVRVTSSTGGQKGTKRERMDLIPPEALWELARVYGMGAEKYDDHNYLRGYDYSLSYSAMLRHATQWANGEDNDSESGLNHLAHAAWHCFALMMYQFHDLGTDDRLPFAAGLKGVRPCPYCHGDNDNCGWPNQGCQRP